AGRRRCSGGRAVMREALAIGAGSLLGFVAGLGGARAMLARGAAPVDVPDGRRLHRSPTPRGGGLGIVIAGVAAAAACAWSEAAGTDRVAIVALAWALPNGLIGLVDDHRPLRSRVKLVLQVVLAAAVCALGLRLDRLDLPPLGAFELGWASWPLSVLWLVWTANLFNFMDGMDGLAAGSGIL